jgi:competence protein ComEC
VAKLVYGDFSLLLTGDASTIVEKAMVAAHEPVAATVLKVAHHGSRSATLPELVGAVQPSLAVIQVGKGNNYGLPNEEVMAALTGRAVLRTDEQGRIHLWSDGQRLWTETER